MAHNKTRRGSSTNEGGASGSFFFFTEDKSYIVKTLKREELDILEEFNLSTRSKLKHLKLENQVLKTADLVLTVSKTWLDDLKRLGAKNIELITLLDKWTKLAE